MFQTLASVFNPASYFSPWSVLAGVLLIAAPIIIHLIHRMRFKRVKWAAMEFLLKAQKRMKRKMIIEQLLLLVLRCLLMLLLGLLVARFFGFDATGVNAQTTHHYVILDDSPSMGDIIQEEGQEPITALTKAKRTLTDQIAPTLADAPTPQFMNVARASEPDPALPVEQVNADAIAKLKSGMSGWGVSNVRSDLPTLIRKGGESLSAHGAETGKVLHVLSDFRAADWAEQSDEVKAEVKKLSDGGVKVHFIDVAHPYRVKDRKQPTYHDNIGIIELKPNKAVVAKFEAVEFTLRLKNFGTAEVKDVRVSVRVNGDEAKGRSVNFASLPPGQEVTEKFELTFDRAGLVENLFAGKVAGTPFSEGAGSDKEALNKAFERFNIISAVVMTKEAGGIEADNVRHTAVEVRDALPILIVDGDPDKRDKKDGDSLYLRKFISSAGTAFQWNYGASADLGVADLSKYSFVMMLNVPTVTEAARKNLEGYVRNGGGVGFWLGGLVRPQDYNKELYRDGDGLFPVPLPPDPFPAKSKDQMSEDEKDADEARVKKMRDNIFQKKLLVRDPSLRTHPALAGLYTDARGTVSTTATDEMEKFYRWVIVHRYWAIERVGKWTEDKSVTELMCLANEKNVGDYDKEADALMNALPVADADFADFKNALTKVKGTYFAVTRGVDVTTSMLAEQFDRLLSDQRNEGDPDEAVLRDFWLDARNKDLKDKVTRLRDRMKYGYPLYLTKTFGRGRVTVMTTTSGEAWNEWPSVPPGSVSFIPIMKELVNYLAGGGVEDTRTCGKPIEYRLDPDGYDPKVLHGTVTHAAKPGELPAVGGQNDPAPVRINGQFDPLTVETFKEKVFGVDANGKPTEAEVERKELVVRRTDTATPGIYLFGLEQKRGKPGAAGETVSAAEYRFAPVNLDVAIEGDLRRASADDLTVNNTQNKPAMELHGPDDREWLDKLKNKKTDLSEMGWLFLFLLLVLVAEQALAVKLSYHSGQETVAEHSPSAAAALRRSNPQPETPAM